MAFEVSRRKFLSAATTAVGAGMVLPMISGCSPESSSTPSSGGVELSYFNHSRGQVDALTELTDSYFKSTGVKVNVETPGPGGFLTKLQSMSQTQTMPDIISAVGPTDMAPYYKAGWAMDLSSEMSKGWDKSFLPAALKLTTWAEGNTSGVKPGVYSAHWEVADYGILANTELFKKAGVDLSTPPATTREFIDQLKKVKNSGASPFQIAASLVPWLVQTHASNWLSDEEIDATFAGKASWKAEGWRNALQLLLDLRSAGVITNNALPTGANDNPDVEKQFFSVQNLASCFDGSFGIGVGRTTAPDFKSFVSFPLPKAPDATREPRVTGIVGRGAAINPKGKNPEEALKFVKWLTEPVQEQLFMDKVPLIPANPAALDPAKVSTQLSGFTSIIDKIQAVPTPLKKQVNEALVKGGQSLVLGERTIDQVLDDLEAAQKAS
jgi:raffinose/stachyose/melibiose transport system substrate-binding protein